MMGSRCSLTSNTTHSNKKTRIVPSLPCTIPCSDGFSDKETIQQLADKDNRSLTIIHFNDVYNIEERDKEPVGGASRFKTACSTIEDPLVLFSGDALSPSNMSIVTKGHQMIPILNRLGVQAAVYGNHDFDFGIDHLIRVTSKTRFPWLLSNVQCIQSKGQLANGKEYLILNWNKVKIGLLGLVEREWLETLPTLSIDDVIYTDYVHCARQYIPILKDKGCTLIIALTHMRSHNDRELFNKVPEIDLVLGGHDHEYDYELSADSSRLFVKSGTDFREFSEINITMTRPIEIRLKRHTITKEHKQDKEVQAIVEQYSKELNDGMDEKIGEISVQLDGRFSSIRSKETNLGNLITDIMRYATKTDIALLNSGTLRSDTTHEPGDFRMKDLMSILPMVDSLVVLEIRGHQLLMALENGVSLYPKLEGRFPQVSGLSFTFNAKSPSLQRIKNVSINGETLDKDKLYKLCTKSYMAHGKDGYTVLKDCPVIVDEEGGITLTTLVRNYIISKFNNESLSSISTCTLQYKEFSAPGDIDPDIEGRINIINN